MDRGSERQNHHGCQGLAEKGALLKTNRAQDGKDPSDENHLPGEKPMQWAGAGALESQGASSVLHGVEMKSKAIRRAGSSKSQNESWNLGSTPCLATGLVGWFRKTSFYGLTLHAQGPQAKAAPTRRKFSGSMIRCDTDGRSGSGSGRVGEWESVEERGKTRPSDVLGQGPKEAPTHMQQGYALRRRNLWSCPAQTQRMRLSRLFLGYSSHLLVTCLSLVVSRPWQELDRKYPISQKKTGVFCLTKGGIFALIGIFGIHH